LPSSEVVATEAWKFSQRKHDLIRRQPILGCKEIYVNVLIQASYVARAPNKIQTLHTPIQLFRPGAGVHASNCSNSKFGRSTIAAYPPE
jgi:hypothetical protein